MGWYNTYAHTMMRRLRLPGRMTWYNTYAHTMMRRLRLPGRMTWYNTYAHTMMRSHTNLIQLRCKRYLGYEFTHSHLLSERVRDFAWYASSQICRGHVQTLFYIMLRNGR